MAILENVMVHTYLECSLVNKNDCLENQGLYNQCMQSQREQAPALRHCLQEP